MRFFQKPRKIIHIWIITYLCILLIPTIANIVISGYFTRSMNEETENYNGAYLSKIVSEADNVLVENIRLINRLETDEQMKEIASYPAEFDSEKYKRIYSFLNDNVSGYSNHIPESVRIYLKKSDCIITNDALAKGSVAYDVYSFDSNIGYDEWKRIMTNSYDHFFTSMGGDLYEIHTLFDGTDHEVNIFMQFEKAFFKWNVSSELFPKGVNIMICDLEGNMIYSTDGELTLGDVNFREKSGTISLKDSNRHDMVCYHKSEVTNWIYLMSVPSERFYANTKNMIIVEVIILIVSLIVGIAGVILFSMHNYRPLKKIVTSLGGKEQVHEYDFIEHSVKRINSRYNDMSKRNLVAQMLTSSMIVREDGGLLNDYGIPVTSKVAAIVMSVNHAKEFIGASPTAEDIETLYGALENVFCEVAQGYGFNAYFTNCEGMISILLDVSGEISVTDLLLKIDNIFETVLEVKCTICGGSIEDNISLINRSYIRAKQVLDLMRFMGQTGTGMYCGSMENHDLNEKRMNRLRVSVLEGSDDWQRTIGEIFTFGVEKPGFRNMRLVLYDISRILLKISRDKGIYSDAEKIKNLAEAESLEQFCKEMKDITDRINSHADGAETESEDNISKIKNFIAENYTNSNLNNSMIADYIEVSVNYISKYFKEQTGEGLLNYITRIRVEKAKELLADTDMLIQDIATEVGFYNALALVRAYKKTEGITPTQYRKIKDERK